jgi:hypothetical protein
MKAPTGDFTASSAPGLQPQPGGTPRRWLPAQPTASRAHDLSHWLSRAARGHTWNGSGITHRRRTH